MKKVLFLVVLLMLLLPTSVLAHGGVEKRAAGVLVTLFQSPLSPFVGEKVSFAFILQDATSEKRLIAKTARLEVIQTTLGDAGKDTVVHKETVTTDVNGIVNFSYTFPQTNYYDVELQFGKEGDENTSVGFLVQPRTVSTPLTRGVDVLLVLSLVINALFVAQLLSKKNILKKNRS